MKNVLAKSLPVLDDSYFNKALFARWYNDLRKCTENTLTVLQENIGNVKGFYFRLNPTMLEEVVYDAIIGLRKIVSSENNEVQEPNPFKIAAHLGYWFIRHKPIMFCQWKENFSLENLVFRDEVENDKEKKMATIWEIKHVNEIVAASFMIRYIFQIDSIDDIVCGKKNLENVQCREKFYFNNFFELGSAVWDKFKYHISYRCITPEVLEHFLEGYTLHPVWELTSKLWEAEEK